MRVKMLSCLVKYFCKFFILHVPYRTENIDNKVERFHISVTCGSLSLSHGSVSYNQSSVGNGKYPVHTKATFSCNYGYRHSGDKTRRCKLSGSWSLKHSPTCTQGIAKVHCNYVSTRSPGALCRAVFLCLREFLLYFFKCSTSMVFT